MSCRVVDLGDGAVGFVCSRGSRTRATCAYCKARDALYLCDYPLTGAKAGKTCDGKLCDACATLVASNTHYCPPHRRQRDKLEAEARASAEAWLDSVRADAEAWFASVTASQDEADVWWGGADAGPVARLDDPVVREISQAVTTSSCARCGGWHGGDCPPERPVEPQLKTDDIATKVAHVRRATQSRDHRCHWPGCTAQVPPARWGCRPHWYRLPQRIRDRIWSAYRVGQEETLTPSREYLDAVDEAQRWIQSLADDAPVEPRRISWDQATRRARERDAARAWEQTNLADAARRRNNEDAHENALWQQLADDDDCGDPPH